VTSKLQPKYSTHDIYIVVPSSGWDITCHLGSVVLATRLCQMSVDLEVLFDL